MFIRWTQPKDTLLLLVARVSQKEGGKLALTFLRIGKKKKNHGLTVSRIYTIHFNQLFSFQLVLCPTTTIPFQLYEHVFVASCAWI